MWSQDVFFLKKWKIVFLHYAFSFASFFICNIGRYFCIKHLRNTFVETRTAFQRTFRITWLFMIIWGRNYKRCLPKVKWFVVAKSKSFTSSDTSELFNIVSVKNVTDSCSLIGPAFIVKVNYLLVIFTIGISNYLGTWEYIEFNLIHLIYHSFTLFAPTKVVPLSLHIVFVWPRRAVDRQKTEVKESVVKSQSSSKRTTPVVKHVKLLPKMFYCPEFFLICFEYSTVKEP